jgi:spore germination protein GerM
VRSRIVLAALTVALSAAACGFPTQDSPQPAALDESPSLVSAAGSEPTSNEDVAVWFVHDDRLVSSTRSVPVPAVATTAIAAITAGVSASEAAAGLRSAIPDRGMVTEATVTGGTALVTLAPEFLDIPAGDQVLALAQIVYTLTDLRGVGRVRFEIDGEPVVVPLPDGGSTEDSVSRENFDALL